MSIFSATYFDTEHKTKLLIEEEWNISLSPNKWYENSGISEKCVFWRKTIPLKSFQSPLIITKQLLGGQK